jgi:hypothetical protein
MEAPRVPFYSPKGLGVVAPSLEKLPKFCSAWRCQTDLVHTGLGPIATRLGSDRQLSKLGRAPHRSGDVIFPLVVEVAIEEGCLVHRTNHYS